jgi:hypothetical protein
MISPVSDATLWFGKPCDFGCALRRPLGKELIESLRIDAALFGKAANGGRVAFLLKDIPHEIDDRPVLRRKNRNSLLNGQFAGDLFVPVIPVGKMPVRIQRQRFAKYQQF